ncbi:MAG: FliH/SctL family protein [Bdellovibrionota bacterium]
MTTLDAKKNGRFIKRNDPLAKKLTITDFSLADICDTPITFHDNASANIVHERLHLKEDLAETVRLSHEIEQVFHSAEERMIIRPLDFTEEWARLRKRQSSRTQRSDDDEEFEMETSRDNKAAVDAAEEEVSPTPEEFAPGGLMDLPGKTPAPQKATQAEPAAPAPIQPPTPQPVIQQAPPIEEEPEFEEEAEAEAPLDDFVPYASQNTPGSVQVSALERYPTEDELEAIRAAAREEGFREGYQNGEERATIEARSKVQVILEEVSNIVTNLEGMQSSILKSAQENFQVITQNLIESMLHREFHLNPNSFGMVIERAIDEALSEDEFKIFVNSKVARELKGWSNQSLLARIRSDDSLPEYDFRIEGQHGAIDASIKKIISDLLDQADLSLFESQDKVS